MAENTASTSAPASRGEAALSTILMDKEQLLEIYAGFKKDGDVVMTL
ncbi:MAG: hypothetical protein OEV28_09230 [Nitrospirota bacterium]|nr:hypothetical protein [Nitrospirota bacterium]